MTIKREVIDQFYAWIDERISKIYKNNHELLMKSFSEAGITVTDLVLRYMGVIGVGVFNDVMSSYGLEPGNGVQFIKSYGDFKELLKTVIQERYIKIPANPNQDLSEIEFTKIVERLIDRFESSRKKSSSQSNIRKLFGSKNGYDSGIGIFGDLLDPNKKNAVNEQNNGVMCNKIIKNVVKIS